MVITSNIVYYISILALFLFFFFILLLIFILLIVKFHLLIHWFESVLMLKSLNCLLLHWWLRLWLKVLIRFLMFYFLFSWLGLLRSILSCVRLLSVFLFITQNWLLNFNCSFIRTCLLLFFLFLLQLFNFL